MKTSTIIALFVALVSATELDKRSCSVGFLPFLALQIERLSRLMLDRRNVLKKSYKPADVPRMTSHALAQSLV
jgi:hypothetical protein